MDETPRISSLEPLLHDIYAKTASGDYAQAFVLLEMARSADPENIYFDALKNELGMMFSREKSETLSEEQHQEMLESLTDIIECAARDTNRHTHAVLSPAASQGSEHHPLPEASGTEDEEAKKELEALKLIYFQRASKFVMKGDYEQALAEVKRVFVVDPESTIARKYATRVEDLIKHARQLAAAPADIAPEPPPSHVSPERVKPSPPVHSRRSTAWDDEFETSVNTKPDSERRNAPPHSKQTVAYGDSLEPSFATPRTHAPAKNHDKKPARSRKTAALVGIIVVVLAVSGTFAVLSTGTAGGGNTRTALAGNTDINTMAAGTLVSEPVLDTQSSHDQPILPQSEAQPPATAVKYPPAELQPKGAAEQGERGTESVAKDAGENSSAQLLAVSTPEKEEPLVIEMKPADSRVAPVDAPTYLPVEKEPQILKLEKPQFPNSVWKSFEEGSVVVRVLVDVQGRPVQTQILKSTSGVFEQPVIDALMKSKFVAGQMGSGPVAAWLTIPFRIKLPR